MLVRGGWLILVAMVGLIGPWKLFAERPERGLLREAGEALTRKDYPHFFEKARAAAELRPEYPRALVMLAQAYALNDQPKSAFATFHRLAQLGVSYRLEDDAIFAPFKSETGYAAAVAEFTANRAPVGDGYVAFTLRVQDGIIEGITHWPKTGDWFFGDVHNRRILRRSS